MTDKVSARDVTRMSLEELEGEATDLAELRTKVRERQVELSSELDIRRALNAMPEEARRIVQLRLEGKAAPVGATETE